MTEVNRLERRKARTRAALVTAAQTFIADGRVTAPVLEITQAADVGMGSFYNHFTSKEDLFQAAVNTALDDVGDYLDSLTGDLHDPVQMFTQSFRLTGRLFRVKPELTRVILNAGARYDTSGRGLAPRCLRDIRAGIALGRFDVDDPELALSLVAGALLAMGRLLMENPERDDAVAVDRMTADLLRALGISTDEARELCGRPLPESYRTDINDVVGNLRG